MTGRIVERLRMVNYNVLVNDQWVFENIRPIVIAPGQGFDFCQDKEFKMEFLEFIKRWKDESICVADFGCPVEASILSNYIGELVDRDFWLSFGPYPLHELGTMMLMADIDVDINRIELCREYGYTDELVQHNPYHDAITTAVIARKLLEDK